MAEITTGAVFFGQYGNASVRKRAMKQLGVQNSRYRCVSDPYHAYNSGAFWGKQDFFATLIEGYFSPGSVWENEAGDRFVVRGNEGLQAAPPPEGDERWRPQRLEAR